MTPTDQATKKLSTSKWLGKAEAHFLHKNYPWGSVIQWEVIPNSQLLQEDQGFGPQIYYPCHSRTNPTKKKYLPLKANGTCIHKTHKAIENKPFLMHTQALSVTISTGTSTEGEGENAHLPVFSWKRIDYILYNLLPESPSSNV